MRKGFAIEGFIKGDGTVKPLEKYDDTEVKADIKANADSIDDLKSRATSAENRITALENGQEIPSALGTPGNFVGFDEDGKLADSGKKPTDFAAAVHSHNEIRNSLGAGSFHFASNNACVAESPAGFAIAISGSHVDVTSSNMANLARALNNPAAPIGDGDALITNGQVYTALDGKADWVHQHNFIEKKTLGSSSDTLQHAEILMVNNTTTHTPSVKLHLEDNTGTSYVHDDAIIDLNNIANLKRALEDPAAPAADGTNLSTNGQVWKAIQDATSPTSISTSGLNPMTGEPYTCDADEVLGGLYYKRLILKLSASASSSINILDMFIIPEDGRKELFGYSSLLPGCTAFINVYKTYELIFSTLEQIPVYIFEVTAIYGDGSSSESESESE